MTTKDKVFVMMRKAAAARRLNDKVMAKRAEYRATAPSEAYMAGFAKAAEECGVDPDALVKQAQLWSRLGRAFDVGKWWPKYIDLLKGGTRQRAAIAKAFRDAQKGAPRADKSLQKALRHMEGTMNEYTGQFQKGLLGKDEYLKNMDELLKSYNKYKVPLDELERNVLLARLGTGSALATGGLYGIGSLLSKGEPSYRPYSDYMG